MLVGLADVRKRWRDERCDVRTCLGDDEVVDVEELLEAGEWCFAVEC